MSKSAAKAKAAKLCEKGSGLWSRVWVEKKRWKMTKNGLKYFPILDLM